MTCPCHDPATFGHHTETCTTTCVPAGGYNPVATQANRVAWSQTSDQALAAAAAAS